MVVTTLDYLICSDSTSGDCFWWLYSLYSYWMINYEDFILSLFSQLWEGDVTCSVEEKDDYFSGQF